MPYLKFLGGALGLGAIFLAAFAYRLKKGISRNG